MKIRDYQKTDLTVKNENLYVRYVLFVLHVLFVFCVLCIFYAMSTMTAFPDRLEPDHDPVTPGHRPPY